MIAPDDHRHASNAGYIAGCREECCRAAHARHRRNRRTRLYLARTDSLCTSGIGTRRRIQALMALGWSTRELDKMLGRRPSYVYRILGDSGDVYLTTATMIADLYERLCMTKPTAADEPGAAIIRRNAKMAARRGYLPPLMWNDIDDPDERPVMRRDSTLYRSAELVAEWDHLRAGGESIEQAARQLGVGVEAIEKAIERDQRARDGVAA